MCFEYKRLCHSTELWISESFSLTFKKRLAILRASQLPSKHGPGMCQGSVEKVKEYCLNTRFQSRSLHSDWALGQSPFFPVCLGSLLPFGYSNKLFLEAYAPSPPQVNGSGEAVHHKTLFTQLPQREHVTKACPILLTTVTGQGIAMSPKSGQSESYAGISHMDPGNFSLFSRKMWLFVVILTLQKSPGRQK